jgi:hypothetical protein
MNHMAVAMLVGIIAELFRVPNWLRREVSLWRWRRAFSHREKVRPRPKVDPISRYR